jgi:hypothetical protein
MLALSPFLLLALSVAVSLWPEPVGAYWTVTAQDGFLPSRAPVQPSLVIENAGEPERLAVSTPEFLPSVSVNCCDDVSPELSVP